MVIVEHPASHIGSVFYTPYLHLQAPPVQAEHVARGAELGRVGETGWATGCHLHLEVRYFRDRVSSLHRVELAGHPSARCRASERTTARGPDDPPAVPRPV